MQVIEFRICIIVVSTIPQRVDFRHAAGCLLDLAVGVIAVGCCFLPSAIYKLRHVPLEVGDVVIGCWAGGTVGVSERIGCPLGIVGKVQNLCCDSSVHGSCGNRLPQKPSAGVDIAVLLRDGRFQNTFTAAAGAAGGFSIVFP